MESKVNISTGHEGLCMACGAKCRECAEILIWLAFMPAVTFRLLICQSCWAKTLRNFSKDLE